jgi:PBP1b-binding outer membrane lipoprotein LpoB
MKTKIASIALTLLMPMTFLGCGSTKTQVEVRPERPGISTVGIDIGDYTAAAESLVKSLLDSPALSTPVAGGGKPLLCLSKILNRTAIRDLKSELLTNKIFDSIQKEGRVDIMQNCGDITDPIGDAASDLERMRNKEKRIRVPDFTLSGTVVDTYAAEGRVKEHNYHLHLVLARGNTVLWEDQEEIRKVTTRSRF